MKATYMHYIHKLHSMPEMVFIACAVLCSSMCLNDSVCCLIMFLQLCIFRFGETTLMFACKNKLLEVALKIVESGCDLDYIQNR